MSQERTKLWYLKNLDLFSHMRKDDYKMVDQHSRMQEIKRGEVLYLEGTPDTSFYLLKKGIVKVSKLLPQGKEIILDIFSGGTVFGELAGDDFQERDESAVALEDGLVCIFGKEDFSEELGRFGEVGKHNPAPFKKFVDWHTASLEPGVVSKREKSLIGVAVAHAIQCAYCIDAYTKSCIEAGMNIEHITEAAHVTSAIRGGASLIHTLQAHNAVDLNSL